MRAFSTLTGLCTLLMLIAGCEKNGVISCDTLHTAGVIDGVAGPDSARVGEQQELTLEVSAPNLCVSDIKVTASFYSDSLYYLDADVTYSEDKGRDCNCEVKVRHYVRVYFTAPTAGTIVLSAPPSVGPAATHTIKVY